MPNRTITGRCLLWTVLAAMGAGAAFGQISPEEAQRLLREKQLAREAEEAINPPTAAPPAQTPAADESTSQWPQAAIRSASYICQVDDQVVCNANFHPRFSRTCWRMATKPAEPTKNSFKVKLGDIKTPIDNRGSIKRTPVLYEIVHQRSDDEQFAQSKAIGMPELDEFGFIHHARVAQIVDAQTVWLDNVRVLEKSDFQAEYKKQLEIGRITYYYYQDDPRYDLRAVVNNTVRTPRGSTFDESLPTPAELYQQRVKMIEWEYEGRLAATPVHEAWSQRRIKLIGVPTAAMHVGQTWNGADTQIAVVGVAGRNVTAVPTSQLSKPVARDAMIELMQKRGFTADSMNEAIRHIAAHRVIGQSTERRIAFLLAGRPLPDDAALLPAGAISSDTPANAGNTPATGGAAPPAASPAAQAQPANTSSLHAIFDVNATLQNMVNETVGDQTRQIDDLLASVFEDWWLKNQKDQVVQMSGVFTNASRVEANTPLTNRLTIGQRCSQAKFAVGKVRVTGGRTYTSSSSGRTITIPPSVNSDGITVGQYRFRVTINALFSGEREMAPLKLKMPSPDSPAGDTLVRGKIVEVHFTPSGGCDLYLQDCELPE